MQQSTIDFLCGLTKTVIQGLGESQKHGIGNEVAEGIEKSRKKLFTIGVSVALAGTGFFLILWGISSAIDSMFVMRGFGFVLIGLVAALAGTIAYKK